jgi:hypothetical protein|mmetsp:Transcript_32858/g.59512  ORF Transcript_32858/g.59512 Transcript_32858/m.59512 type:complete len:100 (-) Transcript_32858:560-859(-)
MLGLLPRKGAMYIPKKQFKRSWNVFRITYTGANKLVCVREPTFLSVVASTRQYSQWQPGQMVTASLASSRTGAAIFENGKKEHFMEKVYSLEMMEACRT